ncbi:hypothetical protein KM1_284240, partial [Entamoeba histolytica HM-3:IMSS]
LYACTDIQRVGVNPRKWNNIAREYNDKIRQIK